MSGLEGDLTHGLGSMVEYEPRLGIVAATLLDLADDDSVNPEVYGRVCEAVFRVLDLLIEARS